MTATAMCLNCHEWFAPILNSVGGPLFLMCSRECRHAYEVRRALDQGLQIQLNHKRIREFEAALAIVRSTVR